MWKIVVCILMVVVVVFLQSSCTDEKEAQRILEAQGYTNIQFTGYKWFACSEKRHLLNRIRSNWCERQADQRICVLWNVFQK